MVIRNGTRETVGLSLLGVISSFGIWSAVNPSFFTIREFSSKQSEHNVRFGMKLGLALCGALGAGLWFGYGRRAKWPALLTGATGIFLYGAYEYTLKRSHINNPTGKSIAYQASGGGGGGAGAPPAPGGSGEDMGGGGGGQNGQPGRGAEELGRTQPVVDFPSSGSFFADAYYQAQQQADQQQQQSMGQTYVDEYGNIVADAGNGVKAVIRYGPGGRSGAGGAGGGGGGSLGGGGGDPSDPSTAGTPGAYPGQQLPNQFSMANWNQGSFPGSFFASDYGYG